MLQIKDNPLPRTAKMHKLLKIISTCTTTTHIEEAINIVTNVLLEENERCILNGAIVLRIHQLDEIAKIKYRLANRPPCTDEQDD
jgi:hypothetical protein